jgi:hypothetical protein
MIYTLPVFVAAYWPYLLAGAAACALLSYFSKRFFGLLQKALAVAAVLFILAAGYELATGSSLFNLPGSVDRKLSSGPENPETGRRYYKSYEERYGENPPE